MDLDNCACLSIIIPVHNEGQTLTAAICKIAEYCESLLSNYEIIVVDDGSTDGTEQIAREMMLLYPCLRMIKLKKNRGKGCAVRNGIFEAKGQYILFSDADLSTPISEAEKLFHYLKKGCDIAIGSRKLPSSQINVRQPWYREFLGNVFNIMVRLLVVQEVKDTQCGFKCFTRKSAKKIFREQRLNGFCFDVEVLYLATKYGFSVKEVPIRWFNAPKTTVKLMKDSPKMLIDLLRIRYNDIRGRYTPS